MPTPRTQPHLLLALLLALVVLTPRAALMVRAHSPTWDENYHLVRGLKFLTRTLAHDKSTDLNDPPLGEAIMAIPLALIGCRSGPGPGNLARAIDVQSLSPDTIRMIVAIWKCLLFLPLVGVVFAWTRSLYGLASAWLAVAMLLIEPTIAGHLSLITLDVLGMEGIVIACYLAWRYFERPTIPRLIAMILACVVALMLKHTAIVVPAIIAAYAALWWIILPILHKQPRQQWRALLPRRLAGLAAAILLAAFFFWALTLFDLSNAWPLTAPPITWKGRIFNHTWPAGVYVRSFATGVTHGGFGHPGYLLGKHSDYGWPYYFPVVAAYKMPLGIAFVLLLGLLSLLTWRPRWREWGLLLPLAAYLFFLIRSPIDIGFRHFLPAYAFLIMLAARSVAVRENQTTTTANPAHHGVKRGWTIAAWAGVIVAAAHVASYHPDYLSYINFPRAHAYLDISDSNLDWGQALKEIDRWLTDHPQTGRPVYLSYFGDDKMNVHTYLHHPVELLGMKSTMPQSGLLILSPVNLVAVYDDFDLDAYRSLRNRHPDAVIGHCILVFDLDKQPQAISRSPQPQQLISPMLFQLPFHFPQRAVENAYFDLDLNEQIMSSPFKRDLRNRRIIRTKPVPNAIKHSRLPRTAQRDLLVMPARDQLLGILQQPKRQQNQTRSKKRDEIDAQPNSQSNRRNAPHSRCGGQAVNGRAMLHDRPRPQEANARHHPISNASRVQRHIASPGLGKLHLCDMQRNQHRHRTPQTQQQVGPKPRVATPHLALQPNHRPGNRREPQPEECLCGVTQRGGPGVESAAPLFNKHACMLSPSRPLVSADWDSQGIGLRVEAPPKSTKLPRPSAEVVDGPSV